MDYGGFVGGERFPLPCENANGYVCFENVKKSSLSILKNKYGDDV
jgi:hypothetical protein